MSVNRCLRYPCDYAYRQQPHGRPDKAGRELHVCSSGGSSSAGWKVATVAIGDGPWRVGVRLEGQTSWFVIVDDGRYLDNTVQRAQTAIEEAVQFAAAIVTAATRAAGTWMHTGRDAEFETSADFWAASPAGRPS